MLLPFMRPEQRKKGRAFADRMPWAFFGPQNKGIVIQKTGCLQRTFVFRGPDIDSADAYQVNNLSNQVNELLKRIAGNDWAVFFEAQRFKHHRYQKVDGISNECARIIENERQYMFVREGAFESSYYLTFVWLPPDDKMEKVKEIFYKKQNVGKTKATENIFENIAKFISITEDLVAMIRGDIRIEELNDSDTLTYLHNSVSLDWFYMKAPESEQYMYIDRLVSDSSLHSGITPMLGDYFIPVITMNDFPQKTYPAILDALNRAKLEYRWVSRYIMLDKQDALKEIEKQQKKWFGARKSTGQLIGESLSKGSESGRTNQGAYALEAEANAAYVDVTMDKIACGYYSTNLIVWDKSEKEALKKAQLAKSIINTVTGFSAIIDEYDGVNVFKGMMPGNTYDSMRRVLATSKTVANILPLSAVWGGEKRNAHIGKITGNDVALMTCRTNHGSNFYLNLNIDDVGHCFIAGPTGAGKSTILKMITASFMKYENTRVIIFDKDRSSRLLTMAMGGTYYEPGYTNVKFQPLRNLEEDTDTVFAAEFIELLLECQHITINAEIRNAIHEAVQNMKNIQSERRTISTFMQQVQYIDPETKQNIIRSALSIYAGEGTYASIFDSNESTLKQDRWTMIEMGTLMKMGNPAILPALKYIFYEIEKTFTGKDLVQLVLDEAWYFLKHKVFSAKLQDWLKTLRKKNVYVTFATQEIEDASKSDIASTILQQCATTIFLPDEKANIGGMIDSYRDFGLSDAEINLLADKIRTKKKRDYLLKSVKGVRQFDLNIGPCTLELITEGKMTPEECSVMLDDIEKNYDKHDWLYEILKRKGALEKASALLEGEE